MYPSFKWAFSAAVACGASLLILASPGDLDPNFDAGSPRPSQTEPDVFTAGFVRANGEVVLFRVGRNYARGPGRMLRVFPDGRLDFGFGRDTNLVYRGDPVAAIEPAPGRIWFGGDLKGFARTPGTLFALTPNGLLDLSIVLAPSFRPPPVAALSARPSGGLLVGHRLSNEALYEDTPLVESLDASGQSNANFSCALRGEGWVTAVRSLADGRILVAGQLSQPGSGRPRTLLQLLPDGSVNHDFVEPSNVAGRLVVGLVDLLDGGLIALMGTAPPTNATTLVRLRHDGTLDPAFATWEGHPGLDRVHTAIPDGDGLLVGGSQLVRLGPDGLPDATQVFPRLPLPQDYIRLLLRLPDRSVVAAGSFTKVEPADEPAIGRPSFFRITEDGVLDVNYGRIGFSRDVQAHQVPERIGVTALRRGGLLVWGDWAFINGKSWGKLCRLTESGALDVAFRLINLRNATVTAVAELGDEDLLIGSATLMNIVDQPLTYLARVDRHGTITSLVAADEPVRAMARLPDGRVVVASATNSTTGAIPFIRRD